MSLRFLVKMIKVLRSINGAKTQKDIALRAQLSMATTKRYLTTLKLIGVKIEFDKKSRQYTVANWGPFAESGVNNFLPRVVMGRRYAKLDT